MREVTLQLTLVELMFTINMMPPSFVWPDPYNQEHFEILQPNERNKAGGPQTRLKIIAAHQFALDHPNQSTFPVMFTVAELWLLDAFINHSDYRNTSIGTNYPIMVYAEKVWNALLLIHAALLPVEYLPQTKPGIPQRPPTVDDAAAREQRAAYLKKLDDQIGSLS